MYVIFFWKAYFTDDTDLGGFCFGSRNAVIVRKPSPDGSGYPFAKRSGTKDNSGQQDYATKKNH